MSVTLGKHRQLVDQAAREIAARITSLKVDDAHVVLEAFRAQAVSKQVFCDAFWLLDNEPGWFPNHQVWHPRLRNLRNHPVASKQLYELWR